MTPTKWPAEFEREAIRNWLQDSSGVGLSVSDSLPDDLAATAQALGMTPAELRMYIFDEPRHEWTPAGLTAWARRNRCNRAELAKILRAERI